MRRQGFGALSLSFCFSVVVVAACTGGSSSDAPDGGASSSSGNASSSSGGSSGGGSSSGGSSGGVDAGPCPELVVGGTNDPGIGGSAGSQVIAQSVADYAGVAEQQILVLTQACKAIATTLGASPADQAQAEGIAEPREKAKAWCTLATSTIQTVKASAGGTLTVQFAPPACRLSVPEMASCQGRCSGAGPCDVTANPMVCTGGKLEADYCEGGLLEGGCKVEAKCDSACDASVIAKAKCVEPTVTVTTSGAANQGDADKLKQAFEASMPSLLSLKAHCQAEAGIAGSFSGTASSVTDIKAVCIIPLVAATSRAVSDVQACAQATSGVVGTIN